MLARTSRWSRHSRVRESPWSASDRRAAGRRRGRPGCRWGRLGSGAMDTVDVDDLEIFTDDEVDSDAGVRPEVEDRELVVDDGLDEQERQILAFERQWWKHAGSKEQAIRDLFGVSSTRYYQMLNWL